MEATSCPVVQWPSEKVADESKIAKVYLQSTGTTIMPGLISEARAKGTLGGRLAALSISQLVNEIIRPLPGGTRASDPSMDDQTWSSDFDHRRKIINAVHPRHPVDVPRQTYSIAMQELAAEEPDSIIYVEQDGSSHTRKEFFDLCVKFALAALSLGLQRFDGINIMGFNSLEWAIADLGTILCGGVCAGIYISNSVEACRHVVVHSGARIIVADAIHLAVLLEACHGVDSVLAIVVWDADELPVDTPVHVYAFNEFLELSQNMNMEVLQERIADQQPEDCCSLVYTSGTTGNPKGVMISHDNVVFVVHGISQSSRISSDDVLVSFLPCSHIAANMMDIKAPPLVGHTVHFADKQALKGSLIATLQKIRPTIFVGVPRIWEKIMARMKETGASSGAVVKAISGWAKWVGAAAMAAEDNGEEPPILLPVAKSLVYMPILRKLGLDRARYMVSSTAPISESTVVYFRSLYMRVFDLYGNSETTGPASLNRPGESRVGTIGTASVGMELELREVDGSGEGEICVRGRGVFIGYLNDPESSAKSMDEDGFFHTGDCGTMDEDGFVRITGRIKELLVTSGGENVAPVAIERRILEETAGVERVVVVGDKKKHLSCLLVLTCLPRDGSSRGEEGRLCGAAVGVSAKSQTVSAARDDVVWAAHIEGGLRRANATAPSNAARVHKFRILERDLTVEAGELTETMKLKRSVVAWMYRAEIDAMYNTD